MPRIEGDYAGADSKTPSLGGRFQFNSFSFCHRNHSTTLGSHSEIAGMYVTAISTRKSAT